MLGSGPLGSAPSSSSAGKQFNVALTPQYCAPERLLRKDLTFDELLATDVYTYGPCLVLMFCG